MDDIIRMAREAGFVVNEKARQHQPNCIFHTQYMIDELLKRFAELVRADERWLSSQRRGVLMFSPYTGIPRHPSDIASDPHGILMLDPEQPIRAARSNT